MNQHKSSGSATSNGPPPPPPGIIYSTNSAASGDREDTSQEGHLHDQAPALGEREGASSEDHKDSSAEIINSLIVENAKIQERKEKRVVLLICILPDGSRVTARALRGTPFGLRIC
ncbi:unnamed protein product [Amoebophrya sp. A25]|nr:unnamed protein product [Amoebophrya sp. A25]|eukprot:GSA25T00026387001.1